MGKYFFYNLKGFKQKNFKSTNKQTWAALSDLNDTDKYILMNKPQFN
jgi:hypothetical protein